MIKTMNDEMGITDPSLQSEDREPCDFENDPQQSLTEFGKRYEPEQYRRVFCPPPSGNWKPYGSFPDDYFEAAKLLLERLASPKPGDSSQGVVAIFLSRHYLELAIKYSLFHSRWLKSGSENALNTDIDPVGKSHNLEKLWETLTYEIDKKPGLLPQGLDLNFVGEFVKEFHSIDPSNWCFRYPGGKLPVEFSAHEDLEVDYPALLFNLQRAYDVLDTLDSCLLQSFGQNREWKAEQESWR